jgi:hypothetical protein
MAKRRFDAEQIVTLFRQIEAALGQGKHTKIACCCEAGISKQNCAASY